MNVLCDGTHRVDSFDQIDRRTAKRLAPSPDILSILYVNANHPRRLQAPLRMLRGRSVMRR